jgi:hypothetical protein
MPPSKESVMNRKRISLSCLATLLMIPLAGNAQNWTAAEQEVLQAMDDCLQASKDHNQEAFLACVHDDFAGWNYGMPAPRNKEAIRRSWGLSDQELVTWWIQPLTIKIHGNVAVINSYGYFPYRGSEGEEEWTRARWTDVMLKQGNRWVYIADHGGDDSMLNPAGP